MAKFRNVQQVFRGLPASDGAGVQLTRIIGTPYINMLDPFLLLDAFGSDQPQDYIAGFPPHPHRGFETVTYMLAGKMRHQDSAGNNGIIEAGGVQWMTAGKGIIHSEMPEQQDGLLAGFQLWVNLPKSHKMTEPAYQEKTRNDISVETRQGLSLTVIAGQTQNGTKGVIDNPFVDPIYWDVQQQPDRLFTENIPAGHNSFIYVYQGEIQLVGSQETILKGHLVVLTDGDTIEINALSAAKYLLIAGKPLNEPIARGGPFVMNTREEINQAFVDYQMGKLA
ncbi:pirin family protein [uncultured Paraglaciecola sp.]|uniref:pirin family protein n=1 Tax=uncultured Paraglaciecola sp. TaxID=1765024 RepID=UPI00259729C9|nr:pirin family protein [uncultured Paraglaciecola sp.]